MSKSDAMEVLTFKVDKSLMSLLKGIPNRSNFIRTAILASLQNLCPLCQGTGVLNPKGKEHWDEFAHKHKLAECDDCCDEVKIECMK